MGANGKRRQNRRAAWLAAFALLFQALLPALHHPAGMALAGALAPGEARHLCLAPGSVPVAPADQDKPPRHQPACAICQAVHAIGGFAPPTTPVLVLKIAEAASLPLQEPLASIALEPFRAQQPRAPPSLA